MVPHLLGRLGGPCKMWESQPFSAIGRPLSSSFLGVGVLQFLGSLGAQREAGIKNEKIIIIITIHTYYVLIMFQAHSIK